MKAADIMTTKVFTIHSLATVAEALAMMQDKKVRSLIVEPSDDEEAYGIISETDIAYKIIAREKNPEEILVYQIVTRPCIVVNPDLSLKNVARLFAEAGIQRAPVIQKELLGIISVTDLLMKLNVAPQPNSNKLSEKIHDTLLHERIVRDRQEEIDRECEIAWDAVDESETE
ncbi:CBS domain-containing protein [Myxosarcina sp. GI1(2024)]